MKNSKLLLFGLSVFALFLAVAWGSCELFEDDKDDFPDPQEMPGDTIWIHELTGGDSLLIGNSLAIGKDGSIYYSKSGGTLHWTHSRLVALNKNDGSVKWESPTLDHLDISSQIVVGDDGTIYVIGYYTLYAIDPNSGQFNWTWKVPETLPDGEGGDVYTYGQIGALALTDDNDLVLGSIGSGSYARALYCISKTGTMKWHNLDAVGWSVGSGIVVGKNDILFFYNDLAEDDEIIAVNAKTGIIQWTRTIAGFNAGSNNIVLNDDGYLICSFVAENGDPFRIHRVDPLSGNTVWSSAAESNSSTKLLGPDGKVYQIINNLQWFDPSTGNRQEFLAGLSADRPGVISSQNQLIIPNNVSWERHLTAFNADGTEDWTTIMGGLLGEPIVISNDQVIYGVINLHPVSRLPTQICAIRGNASLANSGWPRPAHDNRNTSNLNK